MTQLTKNIMVDISRDNLNNKTSKRFSLKGYAKNVV